MEELLDVEPDSRCECECFFLLRSRSGLILCPIVKGVLIPWSTTKHFCCPISPMKRGRSPTWCASKCFKNCRRSIRTVGSAIAIRVSAVILNSQMNRKANDTILNVQPWLIIKRGGKRPTHVFCYLYIHVLDLDANSIKQRPFGERGLEAGRSEVYKSPCCVVSWRWLQLLLSHYECPYTSKTFSVRILPQTPRPRSSTEVANKPCRGEPPES